MNLASERRFSNAAGIVLACWLSSAAGFSCGTGCPGGGAERRLESAGTPMAKEVAFPLRFVEQLDRAQVTAPADILKRYEKKAECHFSMVSPRLSLMVKNVALGDVAATLEVLRSLFTPVPSRVSFEFSLPAAAKLDLAVGLLPDENEKIVGQADFLVELLVLDESQGAVRALGRYSVTGDGSTQGRWTRATIDLQEFGGKKVRLSFRTEGEAGTLALFGNPVLRAPLEGRRAPPNILLLALDTVRSDRLSLYGFTKPTSPSLDALRGSAAIFDQAISNANWSRPSYLSIFAGKMPSKLGVPLNRFFVPPAEESYFYLHNRWTLPVLFQMRGYLTQGIVNNYFILQGPNRRDGGTLGLDVGFEDVINFDQKQAQDAPLISRRAKEWLAAHREDPFFLFVSLDNAHGPYNPPESFRKQFTDCVGCSDTPESRYLAAVAFVDSHVGEILAELTRLGLDSKTHVVIFGDHGEVFDPAHDYRFPRRGLGNIDWCRTLFDHGSALYDEVLRVPLLFRGPGIVPGKVAPQVQLLDLFPTLLELAGVETAALRNDGRSLVPFLRGQTGTGTKTVVSEGMDIRSLRTEQLHYIVAEEAVRTVRRNVDGRELEVDFKQQLFDLAADPLEHHNLADKRPEALAAMRRLMDETVGDELFGLHLRLAGQPSGATPLRYSGTVTTSGMFTHVGQYRAEKDDRVEVDFERRRFSFDSTVGDDTDEVVFQIAPKDASLTLELSVDGRPVPKESTAMGCLGIRFPETPLRFADFRRRSMLSCDRPPEGSGAVFLWERSEPEIQQDTTSDPVMKKMLKDWGYVHEE